MRFLIAACLVTLLGGAMLACNSNDNLDGDFAGARTLVWTCETQCVADDFLVVEEWCDDDATGPDLETVRKLSCDDHGGQGIASRCTMTQKPCEIGPPSPSW